MVKERKQKLKHLISEDKGKENLLTPQQNRQNVV